MTNLICTSGGQQQDWSADYRLYSKARVDHAKLFGLALQEVLAVLEPAAPLVVALDDTLVRKCGTHIDGVAWRRDPLGPPFQTNLVRAQRFLQLSAAWPLADGAARLVPIRFQHAPSAPKPSKDADAQTLADHRDHQRQLRLNVQALDQMRQLRAACPPARPIIFCGDGSYTNAVVIQNLPQGCTYIGRIRKDAKLHHLPTPPATPTTGRPPSYGLPAPTPDQLRADETIPWQTVRAFAARTTHEFRIKTIDRVLWRKSGAQQVVRVVVIAPLAYRLRNGSKLLYRQPAFLLGTDPDLAVEKFVQYYLWRWGIEVNFRDEKQLLGVGEAHVRTPASNRQLPAMVVASYALLWVATLRMHQRGSLPPGVVPPKWRSTAAQHRPVLSTGDLLRTVRTEIWSRAIRPATFYHFATNQPVDRKSQKPAPSLPGTLLAAA